MQWKKVINHILFPSPYTAKILSTIPAAARTQQSYVYSLYNYQSQKGRSLIYALKSKNDYHLNILLADKLVDLIQDYLGEQLMYSYFLDPIVINVPLYSTQRYKRGFNQTTNLAKEFAHSISGKYDKNIIRKTKKNQKQALLSSKQERINNVRGCFSLTKNAQQKIFQKDVIIIDDLITTGATLNECRNLLLKHGARNVIALTIAH